MLVLDETARQSPSTNRRQTSPAGAAGASAVCNGGSSVSGSGSMSIRSFGRAGGGAMEAVGAAARAPVSSMPTSSASVARPLRWAQSARVAMPTKRPATKQRSSRVVSRTGASATSTVRPPLEAGGAAIGPPPSRPNQRASTMAARSARPAPTASSMRLSGGDAMVRSMGGRTGPITPPGRAASTAFRPIRDQPPRRARAA